MRWNWQQSDWPNFQWDADILRPLERQFAQNSGMLHGTFKHLPESERDTICIELLSTEAIQTSRIEGEILDRESVQASLRRLLGLQTDHRRVSAAEYGISEMMVDVYRTFLDPLTHERLFEWHRMLVNGRRDLQDIGRYRSHVDPMQIVSGPLNRPNIHFEAPPSEKVTGEMKAFLDWFNSSEHGDQYLFPLTRAGIAHLYFESIHPFEDGNGRIGRAISEKVLYQGSGHADLILLADQIEKNRKNYYQALGKASLDNEITEWLEWFAKTILEAQKQSQEHIDLIWHKIKLFQRIGDQLNPRQLKVIKRLYDAGPDGFQGGLSAKNYQSIAKTSSATATRDLQDLVEKREFVRTGERKSTRYFLNRNNLS